MEVGVSNQELEELCQRAKADSILLRRDSEKLDDRQWFEIKFEGQLWRSN